MIGLTRLWGARTPSPTLLHPCRGQGKVALQDEHPLRVKERDRDVIRSSGQVFQRRWAGVRAGVALEPDAMVRRDTANRQ
jgi:hypothetical protein